MSDVAACAGLETMLEAATSDTLETMCFFGVLGPLEEMPAGEERISTRLTFQGDANGAFHTTLDMSAASGIAANFLGEEAEDLSRSRIEAVICELSNVICGSVLSHYKRQGHFELSTPEITSQEGSQPAGAIRRVFELESGSIALAMDLRPAA
ncbi:MAG: chemotaxis protein CheX [Bryobacteraceae bacterium]